MSEKKLFSSHKNGAKMPVVNRKMETLNNLMSHESDFISERLLLKVKGNRSSYSGTIEAASKINVI